MPAAGRPGIEAIADDVLPQLEALALDRRRPLLICDADEVLFAFMAGLEGFIQGRGLYFDWKSYALAGNIRRRSDDTPLPAADLPVLIDDFFDAHTELIEPVDGAAEALALLNARGVQIVVLSNVPFRQRAARERSLARHGMPYPLVANSGSKGGPVAWLAERVDAPVFFVDDISRHHTAVRRSAAHVTRLHFVADPRLAALLEPAPDSHHRLVDWPAIRDLVDRHLDMHVIGN